MSEHGYSEDGFIPIDLTEFMREKEEEAIDIFGLYNRSIADLLWQWMKILGMERTEIEAMHITASEQMSIQDAIGVYLVKHGIECGIEKKSATKSQGYVEASKTINGVSFTIPAGTEFKSTSNTYISEEDAIIPYIIVMTKSKTGLSYDYFSTDISYVEEIEKIVGPDGSTIDSDYYTLDPVYHNNIQWTEESSTVIVEDADYLVYVNGQVTKRVEVNSELTGPDTVALAGTIISCVQFPTLSVTNEEDIDGGATEESDDDYKERLLQARRRTFTLGSIKQIILGLEGVRTTKVFQNTGVDQTSIADWDNPNNDSPIQIKTVVPEWSQSFVPGDRVLTLGKITLFGKPVNRPPALYIGIKRDIDDYGTGTYFDYNKIERTEVDPTTEDYRDIAIELNFNDLDKTKTYRFDIWLENPEVEDFDYETNHWEFETSVEGYRDDIRGAFLRNSGAEQTGFSSWVDQGTGLDLMFKTHFKGAGFTSIIAPEDGYGFDNLKVSVESLLDYVDQDGYAPICIQSVILEADEIFIDMEGIIYITDLADFQNVRREIEDSIETYLESLDVGDSVIYAEIHQQIMKHSQVLDLRDLKIKRRDAGDLDVFNLPVLDNEVVDLGSTSFQRG